MPETIETGLINKIQGLTTLDYTKLDFATIKQAIIQFIQQNYPDVQNDFLESNGGVMLIDILSYINDILAFRSDFLANESYLPTATTQRGALNLLNLINYTPRGSAAASGDLQITLLDADGLINSLGQTVADIIVSDPASLPLKITAEDISGNTLTYEVFYSLNDRKNRVIFPIGSTIGSEIGSAVVEGFTVDQSFNFPTEVPANYAQSLSYSNVLEDSILVRINGQEYTRTQNFAFENGPTYTYELKYDPTNKYSIVFGDGIFGALPPANATCDLVYRVGGGTLGNIALNAINKTLNITVQDNYTAVIKVVNTSAITGGVNRESLEFSKFYAPKQFSTQFRTTTGEDYTIFGLGYRDGSNGSVSKCISALRPYLAIYGSASGDYNIDSTNNVITIKTKSATRNVVLDSGTFRTLNQIIDDFNNKAAAQFPTADDVEYYAFSYPSSNYRIRCTIPQPESGTVEITDSNKYLKINFNNTIFTVTLPLGFQSYYSLVQSINTQINDLINIGYTKFIAENIYEAGSYYVELHTTSYFIPSVSNPFNIVATTDSVNDTLGFSSGYSTTYTVKYEAQKFAVGLKYHTPDAYLELIESSNNSYTILGLSYTTGSNGAGRALPMAANYVDLYVLSTGGYGVPVVASNSLKSALRNFINRYKVMTDKISIWNGNIKYIELSLNLVVDSNYIKEDVETNVRNALAEFTSGTNTEFGDSFYVSKVYETVEAVAGVNHVDILDIKEDGVSQLTTGTLKLRNVSTNFNELWLCDEIDILTEYIS